MSKFSNYYNKFKSLSLSKKLIFITFFVLAIISVFVFTGKTQEMAVIKDVTRQVELASVSSLSGKSADLSLVGNVTSLSEASILSESSGRLTRVYKKLGDKILAGEIIAEIENSGERAALLQAEGSYEAAKARRDIDMISSGVTSDTSADVKAGILNTINSTYTTLDDIVRVKTDTLFANPRFESVRVRAVISDAALVSKIESSRISIEKILKVRSVTNSSFTINSDIMSELNKLEDEVKIFKNYIDDLSSAYTKAIPDSSFTSQEIETQKQIVSGARSTISGIMSSLTAAEVTLKNNIAAQDIANRNTGDKTPETSSADAQVKIALGSYNGALSRLQKTIIRSPITGTLNSLTIETGDYINVGRQVAIVSNNGALEIVTYISSDDKSRVFVSMPVTINGDISGVVSRVAEAIDTTSKKIEVKIAIKSEKTNLINGQSVSLQISDVNKDNVSNSNTFASLIKIPISALKITPRGANIFVVESGKLKAVEVKTGKLLGEYIEIKSGINGDAIIVVDARGLKDGQVVEIKQ